MMGSDRRSSLVFQLRMAFLMPFAAFIVIIVGILGIQYRGQAAKDISIQLKYDDKILAQALEARITNTQSSINAIIINLNQTIPASRLNHYMGPDIDADMRRMIYRCMVNTFITFYNTEQVLVVWNNGVTWYGNLTENFSMQRDGEGILQEMRDYEVDSHGKWFRCIGNSKIAGEGSYFAKEYIDIQSGESLGYVILKEKNVFEGISNGNDNQKLYLFDAYGRLIESSDAQANDEKFACTTLEQELEISSHWYGKLKKEKSDRKHQINELVLAKQWKLISVSDMSQAMMELNRSIVRILISTLIVLALLYIFLCRLIEQIMHPIRELSEHMNNSREQLPESLSLQLPNNEVGILITRFNEMTERSQQLVQMLLEEKKSQEQLKFSLLQAQIKPHFLYNSLDTIYCLTARGRMEEGSKITKYLSDYYRHVLSKGMDWVLLTEEVAQTENYLQIQSIRYSDVLDYKIVVDKNIEDVKIPKLTLQPLVENAIYHGIKPLGRKGHLLITIAQEDDTLLIHVIDDGIGMTLEEFQKSIQQEHQIAEGFGLKNVIDRLRFYYGNKCTITLDNCTVGTDLFIKIQSNCSESHREI